MRAVAATGERSSVESCTFELSRLMAAAAALSNYKSWVDLIVAIFNRFKKYTLTTDPTDDNKAKLMPQPKCGSSYYS